MAWLWHKYLKSGNCHIVGIDKVMMPPIELLKERHELSSFISLSQDSCSEQSSSFGKLIFRAGFSITDLMLNVITGCW